MPKINTYSPRSDGRVVVQYERGRGVGLGVQLGERPTLVIEGVPEGATVDNTLPPVFDELGGVWCDLDRAGVNKLIRSLREARDKAFGKDE